MRRDLFRMSGTLKRFEYAAVGFLLAAIKYNLDRAIASFGFDIVIYPDVYLRYIDEPVTFFAENRNYFLSLAITAVPFIAAGTFMTLKRLRDAAMPRWLVALFFVPFVNLGLFGILCLVPSSTKNAAVADGHKRRWLDRIIPESDWGSAALGIVLTVGFGVFASWFSIYVIRDYGITLFLGLPFVLGMSVSMIYGYHRQRTLKQCLFVASLSVTMVGVAVLAAAIEGLLCVIMAAPLALGIALIGATIGYAIQERKTKSPSVLLVLFVSVPVLSAFENSQQKHQNLRAVTTEIIVDRPPQAVWNQLVTFNEIEEPQELLFKAGIAYPIRATIEGTGPGSIRKCVFTTGAFIEPIEVWNEPNLLQFSVADVPPPLTELSFYDSLHLPHLEGHFISEKGEFKLTAISNGKTLLQGTTWYRHNIAPAFYWRLWSDHILHKIHYRVLNHIKEKAEE